jgi:hypothetical protein
VSRNSLRKAWINPLRAMIGRRKNAWIKPLGPLIGRETRNHRLRVAVNSPTKAWINPREGTVIGRTAVRKKGPLPIAKGTE